MRQPFDAPLPPRFACACGALLLVISQQAAAIDEGVRERQGIATLQEWNAYKGPRMTGALLRECVNLDARTHALSAELGTLKIATDAEERALERERHWVDIRKGSLDLADEGDVRQYNESVIAEGKQLEVFNARVEDYNAFLVRHNAAIADYNQKCSGRMYLIRDWIAITPKP